MKPLFCTHILHFYSVLKTISLPAPHWIFCPKTHKKNGGLEFSSLSYLAIFPILLTWRKYSKLKWIIKCEFTNANTENASSGPSWGTRESSRFGGFRELV